MITTALPYRYVTVACRLLLAVVFLVAGISKAMHTVQFFHTLEGYDMLPTALTHPFALALPWIEILIGVYLLIGLFTRVTAIVTAALMVVFLIALGLQIARGNAGNCGCVIGIDNPIVTAFVGGNSIGAWDLIRDGLLLLMAIAIAIAPRQLLAVDQLLAAHRDAEDGMAFDTDVA